MYTPCAILVCTGRCSAGNHSRPLVAGANGRTPLQRFAQLNAWNDGYPNARDPLLSSDTQYPGDTVSMHCEFRVQSKWFLCILWLTFYLACFPSRRRHAPVERQRVRQQPSSRPALRDPYRCRTRHPGLGSRCSPAQHWPEGPLDVNCFFHLIMLYGTSWTALLIFVYNLFYLMTAAPLTSPVSAGVLSQTCLSVGPRSTND